MFSSAVRATVQQRKALRIIPILLGLALLLGLHSNAYGQVLYGSILGTVTDPSGAVIPNSAITVTDTATGQTRSDKSDASGRYSLTNLLPGTYSVTAVTSGFRQFEKTNVVVAANVVTRVDLQLQVGEASEKVNVSAQAVELQTDKADTHTEITGENVVNLPIGGNRNYQTLINLTPGATPAQFINSLTDNPGMPLNTHINGGAGQTNVTTIDGAESVNVWLPQYSGYTPPAETIAAVNVTTTAGDADQGLAGSSSITVITKSGTNQIHGSAYIFHNDQHLNARNFFLGPGTDKPVGIYNNYGATLGGPIKKDKLFYFVSFDGTTQKASANGLYTVPTADQRAGNFSAYGTDIYNPFTGNSAGGGRSLFAGGVIPSQYISPAALKIQSYFPAPNLAGQTNNYAASASPAINRFQYDTKVNWNRTDKHTIFVKYDNMFATSGGEGIFGAAGGPAPGSDPGKGRTSTQVASIGHTYVFSPTLVLDGNVGYQRMDQTVLGTDFGSNYSSTLGIPGLNGSDIRDSGFPNVAFGSFFSSPVTGTTFGVPNWMPLYRTDENYTGDSSIAWTKGAHELRFGFNMVRFHLNHWQPELSPGGPRGYFDFNGQITTNNVAGNSSSAPNQYNAYAQFLLGLSDNTQKGEQYILMTGREWQFGWFAQDRWQVSKKLTVSMGVRYEYYPLMTRCCGKGIERYDPANNDVYLGGRGDVPVNAGISVSSKLFAPRVGLAYRIDEKTVVRAGYGINFDPLPFSRPLRGFYPLTINNNYTALNSFSVANIGPNQNQFIPSTLANGIPPVVGPDLSTGIVPLDPTATERSPNSFIHRGYIQSYNFTLERQLPGAIVASAAYVGQHTVHQLADYDINTGFPGSGTALLPQAATFGRTVPTQMWDGYLSSEYNSLQVAFNKQFSSGLMLKGAYTWSHAIDYADDDGWQGTDWNWGPVFQRNRASAGFDQRQVFQLGWVYDLPFGRARNM